VAASSVAGDGEREIDLLGERYRVGPSGVAALGTEERVLLVAYISAYPANAAEPSLTGTWVTARGLPGGQLFFRGPHELPVSPLARRFGERPADLIGAGAALGGTPLRFGDASVEIAALPGIPVAAVVWAGDDEFPSRADLLFDSSLGRRLPLDAVLALASIVVRRLVAAALP
jgi:hypothetical protein